MGWLPALAGMKEAALIGGRAIKKPAGALAFRKLLSRDLVLHLVLFLGLFHFCFSHLDGDDVDLVLGGVHVSL
jgi:hypothetical protein